MASYISSRSKNRICHVEPKTYIRPKEMHLCMAKIAVPDKKGPLKVARCRIGFYEEKSKFLRDWGRSFKEESSILYLLQVDCLQKSCHGKEAGVHS